MLTHREGRWLIQIPTFSSQLHKTANPNLLSKLDHHNAEGMVLWDNYSLRLGSFPRNILLYLPIPISLLGQTKQWDLGGISPLKMCKNILEGFRHCILSVTRMLLQCGILGNHCTRGGTQGLPWHVIGYGFVDEQPALRWIGKQVRTRH